MKESYVYLNDKIVVTEEKENRINFKIYEYSDNIEDILVVENILESLNKEKIHINKLINEENNFIHPKLNTLLKLVGFSTLIFCIFVTIPFGIIETILVSFFIILSQILLKCCVNSNDKYTKNKINGFKLELDKIIETEEKYKKLLNELNNNKTKSDIKNIEEMKKDKKIMYKQKLEEIKILLLMFREIGFNENLFEKYYKKGILDNKLNKTYTENEIQIVKQYFKDKKTTI